MNHYERNEKHVSLKKRDLGRRRYRWKYTVETFWRNSPE
jgi:hypothetical protein